MLVATQKSWFERNLVFYPTSKFHKFWRSLIIITCTVTATLYPYITAFRILEPTEPIAIVVLSMEGIMLLDMIYHFLLAYVNEGETNYITDISKIARRYAYSGAFIKDFIVWQPFFYYLSLLYEPFLLLLLIKCARFQHLFSLLSDRNVVPLIRSYFDGLNERARMDPARAEDRAKDHNLIVR